MNNLKLGRLERVDLRRAWSSEAGSFTPWLARPENLALLGESLGLQLEYEATEKNVGPFRADLLCRDLVNDHWVLIENQLETTDHKHLGQLLTYASGLEAVSIIWVAEQFTEEHRSTLDWLNKITDDQFSFFGVEIELWTIEGSVAAPKFNVVCKPNNWSRAVKEAADSDLTETRQLQLLYWTEFAAMLEKHGKTWPHRAPRHWHDLVFSLGRQGLNLGAFTNSRDGLIGVSLRIEGPNAATYFRLLERERAAIDLQLGGQPDWQESPDITRRNIIVRRANTDPSAKADWPAQHLWLMQTLERFYETFQFRAQNLNAADYVAENEPLE